MSRKKNMRPGVALITKTNLDLNTLLPLCREMLGYSPASAADGVTVPLPELVHQLACVAAFKDRDAPPTVRYARSYLGLFSVGFLIASDERDMTEIIEALHGMDAVITETMQRGVQATIASGTLAQWQRAVKLACHPQAPVSCNTRHVFNMVYQILGDRGLRDMFDGVKVTEQPDHTFLLEDQR
jgi:hypothetical protein